MGSSPGIAEAAVAGRDCCGSFAGREWLRLTAGMDWLRCGCRLGSRLGDCLRVGFLLAGVVAAFRWGCGLRGVRMVG